MDLGWWIETMMFEAMVCEAMMFEAMMFEVMVFEAMICANEREHHDCFYDVLTSLVICDS